MRAALYKRVSSSAQARDGYSLAFQEEIMRDYCTANHLTVTQVYEDGGRSGSTVEREGLKALVADARLRAFEVVLIFRVDRFSRDPVDLLFLVQQLNEHDIKLKSVTEAIDASDAAGELILTVLGAIGKFVRSNIIQNAMLGKAKQAEEGRFTGGAVPFGYRVDPTEHLVPDRQQFADGVSPAELVGTIFRWYSRGDSLREVVRRLNERTEPARRWNPTAVRQILMNPVYLGDYVWGKTHQTMHGKVTKRDAAEWTIARHAHEALVGQSVWEAVQGQLKSNRTSTTSAARGHDSLTGLLHCGICGSLLTRRTPGRSGGYIYFTCGSRYNTSRLRDGTPCAFPFIRGDDLREAVWSIIRGLATDPRVAATALETADTVAAQQQELQGERKRLETELVALKRQEARLLDLVVQGHFNDDVVAEKAASLRQHQRTMHERLDALVLHERQLARSRPAWLSDVAAFQRYFAALSHEKSLPAESEREIFLAAVSDQGITVFPDGRCTIALRVPSEDPTTSGGSMVHLLTASKLS